VLVELDKQLSVLFHVLYRGSIIHSTTTETSQNVA